MNQVAARKAQLTDPDTVKLSWNLSENIQAIISAVNRDRSLSLQEKSQRIRQCARTVKRHLQSLSEQSS